MKHLLITIAAFMALCLAGCKPDNPTVYATSEGAVSEITWESVTLTATANPSVLKESDEVDYGFVVSQFPIPTPENGKVFLAADGIDATNRRFTVVVAGLEPSTTYYYMPLAYSRKSMSYFYGPLGFFTTKESPVPKGAVDLGLSVYWAECNVGAISPEDFGNYYAWAETSPKSVYDWDSYKYHDSSLPRLGLTKYNSYSEFGIVDNLTELLPEDDAASMNIGLKWRTPTFEQWSELRTECEWVETTLNDVNGYRITGPNGNSIFIPTAGEHKNDKYYPDVAHYWTASEGIYNTIPESNFYINTWFWYDNYRYRGFPVRAIIAKDME